jgi:hypothetical protein
LTTAFGWQIPFADATTSGLQIPIVAHRSAKQEPAEAIATG